MLVLEPYRPLWDWKNHFIMLKSGRDAGKSKGVSQRIAGVFIKYELDILVCRSNYGDLEKSMYSEILAVLEEEKLLPFIEQRKRPLKIINKLNGNIIYFEGIGGADLSRSKGFKPHKELSLIVVDETQQLPDKANLDQALATFRRHLNAEKYQVILAFNPERYSSHWLNEEFRLNQLEDDWLCIHTSYLDIAGVLSEVDLNEIRREKRINPPNYRYLYLGQTDGLFGLVYFTFKKDFHMLKHKKVKELIDKYGIFSILIGVDGATTIDKTAFIPTIILGNGQGIVVEYFYYDPERNGAMSNDMLFPHVQRWLDFIMKKYNISSRQRIDMIFDSASADLRLVATNRLPSNYVCTSYSQKNVIQMAHIMQNAFGRNVLYILDDGGIHNYYTGNKEYGNDPLVRALETVIWDEQGKGFDRRVPNDTTDALTYSIAYYFKNPQAIYFPKLQDFYERGEED